MMRAKKILDMSLVELEKKYGVKTQKGKLSYEGGKYYLDIGGEKNEINPHIIVSPKPLEKSTRAAIDVNVIYSLKLHKPIIFWSGEPPFSPVLCYIVARDELSEIDIELRSQLIMTLAKKKILPEALAKQLMSDIVAETKG